jgi:BirA family biotin operon repressor/biotin-[acetyl-CoA-carboxylase] ligase
MPIFSNLPLPISFEEFPALESSNKTAWQKIQLQPNINNHVIIAAQQSSGRGRSGRIWQSPLGNLYFSFIHKVQNKNLLEVISFLVATSLNQTARFFLPNKQVKIENKWPNDLLIDGKKISGILIENKKSKFGEFDCVIGVGINLISSPVDIAYPATNFIELESSVERIQFLEKFLENFFILINKFQNFGFEPIRNLWIANAFRLKQEIILNLFNKKLSGIFEDIDKNGFLILRKKDSSKVTIDTAEIIFQGQ